MTALDGQQALDLVIENVRKNDNSSCDYKLILMDSDMPFMDGMEATNKIRSFFTQMSIVQPSIVGCTGHSDQKSINELIQAGMNEVLMKPINPQNLNDIVSKIKFKTSDRADDKNMDDEVEISLP